MISAGGHMHDVVLAAAAPTASPVTHPTFIRCPATHGLVPTGVYVTELAHLDPVHVLPFCPDCGADHGWTPSDATFGAL